ncbi:MAG: hypothetical protein JNK82_20995 [Myxococcaceae bacterium]|nr:hypothetical protein [Myxococcaceae bacterium]
MLRLVTLVLLLPCSCSLALRRGNALYDERDFLGAVAAYDDAVAEDPDDTEAVALRDEARTQALGALLQQCTDATRERRFADAATALGKAFELSDTWSRPGTGTVEFETLGTAWLEDLRARLAARGPLSLVGERSGFRALLPHPRFAPLITALEGEWSAAVTERCDAALASVRSPFFAALTTAYCRAAGRDVTPSAPELPLFSVSPRVEDGVRGASGPWPVTLTQAFGDSPWAWRSSTRHASMSASGQLEVIYSDRPVTRTAEWTVTVPYSTTRWAQVPYTTYQYYTYPCGRSVCSGSRPVTQYRSQPQQVTEYRTEPRSQAYAATESRAELSAQVNLFVDLRPHATVLGTVLREQKVELGFTHGGVAAAGLAPGHARLPSKAEWDTRMRKAAYEKLVAALVAHWRDNYCNPPLADAEAAARCTFGGNSQPDDRRLLDAAFRDDVSTLVAQPRFGL